jgi:MFS transporter, DHA3 family, macrolide efflux protein
MKKPDRRNQMKKLFEVFKKKNYRNLFLATFTSQMGSVIGMTAFMFYLLNRFSEQPAYATVTELMYSLPTLAVFFIVGVLADRMDRQKIASNCDWLSAILSVAFLGSVFTGWMPLVFGVLFFRSAISKFFYPAESALVQGILDKDEYATAAGLNQMTQSLFNLFGGALGALAYWHLGIEGAIMIDAISFAASALFIRTCKISEDVRMPNGKEKLKDLKLKSVLKDFNSGMVYILNHKLLLSLILGFFIFGIVNGGLSVMPAFILKYKLAPETYEQMMVYAGIIFGAGILIGSVVASILASKLKFHQMLLVGLVISGGFLGICAIPTNIYLFFFFTFIVALSLPFVNIAIGGWLPSIVDPKMMGRVQGWITPLMMLSQSITLGIIAVAYPKVITIEGLFLTVGGCILLVAIYYAIVLPKYTDVEFTFNEVESPKATTI